MYRIIKPEHNRSSEVLNLAAQIRSPGFIAELLLQRGVKSVEDARGFFLASPDEAAVPELLSGYNKALDLFLKIKQTDQKVLVHGDYDVDGIAGTAVMFEGLTQCGINTDWFIPNRFKDGYGITMDNIRKFHQNGVKWIVTVDTGISALEEVKLANELGMNVIITDHHQIPAELPPAEVIINPNLPECNYPNKHLCGAGIAFKVIEGLYQSILNKSADEFIEYAALATLADSAFLTRENRNLVRRGLRKLPNSSHPGIEELINKIGLNQETITSDDILFKVVPMLNAAGRLSSPDKAFRLLTSKSRDESLPIIEELLKINEKRKNFDREAFLEAVDMIENNPELRNSNCITVGSDKWHEGIIGIVAAKLVDRYNLPAFVLSIENGIAKGSGRTVKGFNLHEAVTSAGDQLVKWGGHYFACGFSIEEKNITAFREKMNKLAFELLGDNKEIREVFPSVQVNLNEINEEVMTWLARFGPFGSGNENPLFYTDKIYLDGNPRIVGQDHLKFKASNGIKTFDAIGFGLGHLRDRLLSEKTHKLAFYPEWNIFRDTRNIQLRIVAIE